MWDPNRYLVYADERERPFLDLVARIPARDPHRVVDLGCGPANATARLLAIWPHAHVLGIDSSPEMVDAAREHTVPGRLDVEQGDLAAWKPEGAYDVVVSNSALHWVRGHAELLTGWTDALAPGGALAFQVPGNFTSPTHTLLADLAASPRWRDAVDQDAAPRRDTVLTAAGYLDLLAPLGLTVDAWETEYQHVLPGEDAVLRWVSGTALRPVLAALDPALHEEFTAEYAELLRGAYPKRRYGTVLAFRRIFVIATRP